MNPPDRFDLVHNDWESGPVAKAKTFWQVTGGVFLVPRGWGVLLPTWSVHGWGMTKSLWAVGLDKNLTVMQVRRLRPFGMVNIKKAFYILELRFDREPPRTGWRLRLKPEPV